jgi:hypothetical protein
MHRSAMLPHKFQQGRDQHATLKAPPFDQSTIIILLTKQANQNCFLYFVFRLPIGAVVTKTETTKTEFLPFSISFTVRLA